MSIIQRIRDKAAWVILIAIAVALIGFLVQDAFVGKGGRGLFGGNSTSVGSVNGKKLELVDFEGLVAQAKSRQQYYALDDAGARDQAWESFIATTALADECDKLGIMVTSKEVDDMLYVHPAEDLKNSFKDTATGQFNPDLLRQQLANIKRSKNKEQIERTNQYLDGLMKVRVQQKFMSLISGTVYYPKWMLEKQNSENSSVASVSYVNVPYSSISDSTVKVSDDDIQAYVNKHKDEFKQPESRSIAYVTFNADASAEDSLDAFNKVNGLKNEFATTTDIKGLFLREGNQMPYYESKISGKRLAQANKDSLLNIPVGSVYGPYLDNSSYVLARMISKAQWPDTVKVRHILIATHSQDQQTGQLVFVREDSTAKKIADSVATAIRNGSNFDSLVVKLSDDPGSKDKGGVYDNIPTGQMMPTFNDFIFSHKPGEKGIVKTDFGYHYVEVLSQKGSSTAYEIAYLAKPIKVSQNTEDKASGLANQFAGESRTAKAFDEAVAKRKYNKLIASDITPLASSVGGLGEKRDFVRWIYKADLGEVSDVYNIGNKYVVAVVTEINKEGTMSPAKARPLVEFVVRNEKKAEQIKKKIGTPASLEDVAAKNNVQVAKADSVRFSSPFLAAQESKVGGYAFSAAAKDKKVSPAIAGNAGVYVLRTDNVYALPTSGLSLDQQRQMLAQRGAQSSMAAVANALKKIAKIKDNRSTFF